MVVDPKLEFINCNADICFQKFRKEQTLESDKMRLHKILDRLEELKMSDVEFHFVDKSDKHGCRKVKEFIEKYEWLGNIPNRPTHRFILTYCGEILAVLIMATPNAFSHLLGKENMNKEKLVARGASMSLAPKNAGSFLIMKAIRWMVDNTDFRYFTCYSDPEAKELGTVYQACNFIYLGCSFGAGKMYTDPSRPNKRPFTEREFRKVSYYKRYARDIEIEWQPNWSLKSKMLWENIPDDIEKRLRQRAREKQSECIARDVPPKHKYVYILGRDKRETKVLRQVFKENNPKLIHYIDGKEALGLPYPSSIMRGKF